MVGIGFRVEGFEDVAVKLDRYRQNMSSMQPAFQRAAEDVRTVIFGRTFAQQGLDGTRWASLSPAYAAYKERVRPGRSILVFDGDLRESMTSPRGGITEAWASGFTVGTDIPYAAYHQKGTATMPARPIVGQIQRQDMRRLVKIFQRFIVEGTA